ncbi:VCBS repeat-containing protein [Streptomyces sp. NRRL S-87]|uniref:FG-GAP repeat domain-containing protein n=1 Tax=Streptomyces sp. NRRL S-87 TaxID=1463920 RepID=UPI00099BD847
MFAARTQIPGAYKGYKRITGAGDLNGDGHGDLVLHDTGNDLWRMSGLGGGKFSAPVKLADDWGTAYNAVVGVGDVTGDGRADLIARDASGVVWRYAGTGQGTFGSRVQMATGWQGYAAVLGVVAHGSTAAPLGRSGGRHHQLAQGCPGCRSGPSAAPAERSGPGSGDAEVQDGRSSRRSQPDPAAVPRQGEGDAGPCAAGGRRSCA